ncbi:MAG: ABC transporter ATP-binding protein [Deltaproteobacteria bacterium]|nr:ABC transporter ATP-binding protein [Deltaproteobacteria bacterium]
MSLTETGPAFEHGLWARDLWRAYGTVAALCGLDLTVAPGEVVGLLGPNGAGKSTALRLVCGLGRADKGRTRLAGIEVADHPEDARAKLGFLAQDTLLYPRHTVVETLALFASLQGLAGRARADAVARWMDRLHLHPLADRTVGTLSSGERQRANLARALVHDPPVVILDEPTTALDPETVDLLLDVIRGLKAEGRAVLLCTHALADAEMVVDRAVLIHAGRTVAEGTLAALMERTHSNTLTAAFLALVRALATGSG